MRSIAMIALCAALAACGTSGPVDAARSAADAATKAVYADDFDAVKAAFASTMQSRISRGEVGLLSDKLHALGAYGSLTLVEGDPIKNEYVYRATFEKGSANIAVRLDSQGRLAAYRLFSQT